MGISVEASDLDRLQRKALDKIAFQIEQEEEQERQAEELRKAQVSAQIARQQTEKDAIAVAQLSALPALYIKRLQLGKQLTDPNYTGEVIPGALAAFCQVDAEIRERLSLIDLSAPPGTPPNHANDRRQALRQRAGLSPWHWRIELRPLQGEANRQALVTLAAIARGFVAGDGLRAAGVFTRIDTDDGV